MGKNNVQLLNAKQNTVVRKHMYKSKGVWKIAGFSTIALGTVALGTGLQVTNANADSLPSSTTNNDNGQSATNSAVQSSSASVSDEQSVTPANNSSASVKSVSSSSVGSSTSVASNTDAQVSATNSVNDALRSTADNYNTSGNSNVSSSSMQMVSNQSPASIKSDGESQVNNISQTGSANQNVTSVVNSNKSNVQAAGGDIKVASNSNVDTYSMTSDQISQHVNRVNTTISATGDADRRLVRASNNYRRASRMFGESLLQRKPVNTAANLYSSDIQKDADQQMSNISQTGSGNQQIGSTANSNSTSIDKAGGVETPGSAIHTESLTSKQISLVVRNQDAMLRATGQGDTAITNAVGSNNNSVLSAGGSLERNGVINTANNMNPKEVASLAQRYLDNINATGSGDAVLNNAYSQNNDAISANGGSIQRNSSRDVSSLSPEQINTLVRNQITNIHATGSANSELRNDVGSALPEVSSGGGYLSAGSTVDVSRLRPDQITALQSNYSMMVSATASADGTMYTNADQVRSEFGDNGATISSSGTINTADDMNPSDIASTVYDQLRNIWGARNGNVEISQTANDTNSVVNSADGKLIPGSGINVTGWSPDKIASLANFQSTMISDTGSADSTVNSYATSFGSDVTKNGGTILLSGNINTADNMHPEDILSTISSQYLNMSNTASGDNVINQTVSDNNSSVSQTGGILAPGSAIDVHGMTTSQIASLVSHQSTMIYKTGSADSYINSQVNDSYGAASNIHSFNGHVYIDGTINTADNMTPSQVESTVRSQDDKFSLVGSGDVILSDVVDANNHSISNFDGVEKPGSNLDTTDLSPEQISSIINHQTAMVNATGSADFSVSNTVNSNTPDVTNFNGSLISDGTFNTADNMTPEEIHSLVDSQNSHMTWTGSANVSVSTGEYNNSDAIHELNGKEKPGSAIDLTSMTQTQVDSIVSHQNAMLSTTGSADMSLSNTLDSTNPDIMNFGGSAISDGTINTADNMTPSDIIRLVNSENDHIEWTQSANNSVSQTVDNNSYSIYEFNGQEKPGSAIDLTDMSVDEINSIVSHQNSMVNATGKADDTVSAASDAQTENIEDAGGHNILDSTVNTADDMTADQVARHASSQSNKMNFIGSADQVISAVASNNSDAIDAFYGTELPGSNINATSFTSEQIASLTTQMSNMVSATGSADTLVSVASDANTPAVYGIGAHAIKDGDINTADNMNQFQISHLAKSYADRMNWVGSADAALSNAASANGYDITKFNGSEIPGSDINGNMLNQSQITSLVNRQSSMLYATGDADKVVSNMSANNTFDINNFGGIIRQTSTVNTADNMTPSKVSRMASIDARQISAAGSGDLSISQTVAHNSQDIYGFNGNEHPGSGIDITSMSVDRIQSIVNHQNQMVNATGSADSTVMSASDNAIHDINAFGGDMTNNSTVNTADNQTASYLYSNASYQASQINSTASGDRVLSQIVAGNSAAISGFNGKEKPGSAIDTTNLPLDVIASIVTKQSAMVNATGYADNVVSNASHFATSDIQNNNGNVIFDGTVNTADNMTSSEVRDMADSESQHIIATGSGDNVISTALSLNSAYISNANATATPGSHIDTTHLTLAEIASITSQQSTMLSATGSADSHLKASYDANQDAAKTAGAFMSNAGDINTADNMNADQIASINAFQTNTLSAVGSADTLINQSRSENNDLSTPFGGSIDIGSNVQDMTGRQPDYIQSIAFSQLARISQVASDNVTLSQTQDSVANDIINYGGQVAPGSVIDVTGLNSDSVVSITNSQNSTLSAVGRGDSWLHPVSDVATGYIQDAKGQFVDAGNINMGNWSAADILSFAASQAANISHVGYGDSQIAGASHAFTGQINTAGGQLHELSALPAQYMDLDAIDSFAQSQSANMSQVALANPVIASASANNTNYANANHGYMTSVTAQDATSMFSEQISNFAKSTADRLNAVGSQDSAIASIVNAVNPNAVTLGSGSDVTTMKSNDIDQVGQSQVNIISATNSALNKMQSDANGASDTWNFGGHISHLPMVDTTNMRPSNIDSMVNSNEDRLSIINSANSQVSQTSADQTADIKDATAKGNIIKGRNIDTTNMSSNSVATLVTSQDDAMKYAAFGNSQMGSLIRSARAAEPQHMGPQTTSNNRGKIIVPQKIEVTGSVQMDGWSPASIGTYMASEAAMVKATGSVAAGLSNAEDAVSNDVMTVRKVINVDVTNPSEVQSVMDYNSNTVSSAASKQASENHSFATYLNSAPHNPGPNDASGMEPVNYLGRATKLGGQDITMGLVPNSQQGGNIIDDGHSDDKGDNRGVRAYAPHLDNEHIVDSIHWDQNSPVPYNVATGEHYNNSQFYVPSGTTVRFPQAVQMVSSDVGDHGYIDLDVTFSAGQGSNGNVDYAKGISVHPGPQNSITSTVSPVNRVSNYNPSPSELSGETQDNPDYSTWPLYKSNGELDHMHATTAWNDNTNTMKFQIVPPAGDKNPNYLFASAIGDIDTKQQVDIGDNALIGMGEDLKIENNKVTSASGKQYNNFSDYPKGVAVFAKYGNSITFKINNQPWASAAGLQQAAFGTYWRLGAALYRPTFDLKSITSNVKSATVAYHPMDMAVNQDYNYTYTPLNTNYKALDTNVTPMSTQYNKIDDLNGFNPQKYDTTPLAATYQKFSTNGNKVNPYNPDGTLNGKFTGYAPLDVKYNNFSTDGSKLNPYNPDGSINQHYTGYTPLSINYQNYKTDGSTTDKNGKPLNPYLPDGHLNPTFTGYTPLNVNYNNYTSDGSKVNPLQPNGTLNPHFSGYTPIDMHYKNFDTDGTKVNPYNPDGTLNRKFTGYAPLDMHYQNYETNGHGVDKKGKPLNPYLPDGKLNPKFTGYTPFNVRYKNFESNGQGVDKNGKPLNPYLPNGQLNPAFTGYTPFNDRYKNFVTDGTNINPRNPDGSLNPRFTGYTPLDGTYKRYVSDGRNINPYLPNGSLNPAFTGYTPLSTTYSNYSNDGKAIGKDGKPLNPYLPNGSLNPRFTGFTPLNTTYKTYVSDGKAIGKNGKPLSPYLPNGSLNPEFTGFTPLSTQVTPLKTTYKTFETDGKGLDNNGQPLNPYNPDGTLNKHFTGFTSLTTSYHPYSSDSSVIPADHQNNGYVPYETHYTPYVVPEQRHSPQSFISQQGRPDDKMPVDKGVMMPHRSVPSSQEVNHMNVVKNNNEPVQPNIEHNSAMTPQTQLPQTGAQRQDYALLGLSTLALALGVGFVGRKKKK